MSKKITIENVTLYPAFAKATKEDQLAYFRKLPSVKTDAQAKKLHNKYLKLSGNEVSNTRKTKRKPKKDNA